MLENVKANAEKLYTQDELQDFIRGMMWCILFEQELHEGGDICPPYAELRRQFKPAAMAKIEFDAHVFLWRVDKQGYRIPAEHMVSAGVDFHFTRQGHGVGFGDSDCKKKYGNVLAQVLDHCSGDAFEEVYIYHGKRMITGIEGGIQNITTNWERKPLVIKGE